MKYDEAQEEFDSLFARLSDLQPQEKERHTRLAFALLTHRANYFQPLLEALEDIISEDGNHLWDYQDHYPDEESARKTAKLVEKIDKLLVEVREVDVE